MKSIALILVLAAATPAAGESGGIVPPDVPTNIEVPAGYKPFLVGRAIGTQNYICLPSGWVQFSPQATLFTDDGRQNMTHFLSPNPDENGLARATWQTSRDTSAVWARTTPAWTSFDPNYVAPGAIPWLLLEVVGEDEGPGGGDKLTSAVYIQRVNTTGGIAPSTGCSLPSEVGAKMLVPYTADYFFYKKRN
jgi:Protein of unknown function (DUF3455)